MESREKVELLEGAIKEILMDDDDEHRHLISKLLSQLDSLKEDGAAERLQGSGEEKQLRVSETSEKGLIGGGGSEMVGNEEIVKEIREIKKQNSVSHRLLSAMIVLTLAWQLSEVSLILKLKDRLSHPFQFIGGVIGSVLRRPAVNGEEQLERDAAAKQGDGVVQAYNLPGVKVPDISHALFGEDE